MTECVSGLVESRERVGEDPGSDQGAQQRHTSVSELRNPAGSSRHGISDPRELHEHPGDLCDRGNEDHNTAVAVWMPPRLHPQEGREHQLKSAAQMVHADCAGW